jgi:pyridoxine 5-phosphate synthase
MTVHLRPDERHAKFSDVRALSCMMKCVEFRDADLNVEGFPSADFLQLVRDVVPEQVTLVPDARPSEPPNMAGTWRKTLTYCHQ